MIFSPMGDVELQDDYFTNSLGYVHLHPSRSVLTNFTVCLSGEIRTKFDIDEKEKKPNPSSVGFDEYCRLESLNNSDLNDISRAMKKLSEYLGITKVYYNRKLKKIVYKNESNR
jgi:hypothetical protein